jgi:hypothetical protein
MGVYACMSPKQFTPFTHQASLYLETYQKTDAPVATPVSCAKAHGRLDTFTENLPVETCRHRL